MILPSTLALLLCTWPLQAETSAMTRPIAPMIAQPAPTIAPPVPVKKLTAEEELRYLRKHQPPDSGHDPMVLYLSALPALLALVLIVRSRTKRQRTNPQEGINNMLRVSTTTGKSEELTQLKIDLHSHLIPGIDDGAKTMDEAIELILKLKTLGYTKLITTPHITSHRYPNTSAIILKGLKELQIELRVRNIDIEIEAASEYYLDEHFMQLFKQRDLLTFGDSFVLFEMSYVNHPLALFDMVRQMQKAGYKPVLAHPERYLYMHKAFEKYEQLKAMGVYFQLNLNSLAGYYSAEVKAAAMKLVERGMVDFVGSDTHKLRHVQTLSEVFETPAYMHLCKHNRVLNNLL